MALYPAITDIGNAGGGLDDFERLLHCPAEAGEPYAMQTLASKFDQAGREAEANAWLRESADTANVKRALSTPDGGLELANRREEAEQLRRRITGLGNAAAVH